MEYEVVYDSNSKTIGDGIRVMRVSGNGTILEILTDPSTGRFSKIKLKAKTTNTVEIVGEPYVTNNLEAVVKNG